MSLRIAIFARWPEAGRCKTRLIPAIGAEGAARVHRQLVERTIAVVRASGLPFELWGTGASHTAFTEWLGKIEFKEQPDGDLGDRLKAATCSYPVMFLGTDAPDLTKELLMEAASHLHEGEPVIGPAHDGGYWTLGLTQRSDGLFEDIPWGTDQVFSISHSRMLAMKTPPHVLPSLHDLDRPEDLSKWPELVS